MDYKLTELIDIPLLQNLQEKLNIVYSFPSSIIDNDGNVLTAVAWQDICTKFHRKHPQCEKECIKSDKYILEHLPEANPAISYRCPHGLIDNAIPIMIDGKHLGNFFTGQFFLEKPDLDFFKKQAGKYGFDEKVYLEAVERVPIWTEEKLAQYLDFIRAFIEIIAGIGLAQLKQNEANKAIQERMSMELILHESEERFNLAMKASTDGLFDWNLETNAIYYSPSWKKMLGYEDQELPNDFSIWENLTEPEDVTKSWNLQRKLISGELDRFVLEFKMKHKKGHWVDILARAEAIFNKNGKAVRIVGTHTDITRRKQAEEELRIKGEIVENMAEGVFLVQTKNGTIVYANATIEKMFGARSGELIGKNIQELNAPTEKSPEQTAQEIQQSLFETGVWQGEVQNIKLDGTPFWCSAKVSTFNHLHLGEVWIGIHEDITV